jgi:hypothetical protein
LRRLRERHTLERIIEAPAGRQHAMNENAHAMSPFGILIRLLLCIVIGYALIVATFTAVAYFIVKTDGGMASLGTARLLGLISSEIIDSSLSMRVFGRIMSDRLILDEMGGVIRGHHPATVIYGTTAGAFLLVGLLCASFSLRLSALLLPVFLWFLVDSIFTNGAMGLSERIYRPALACIEVSAVVLGLVIGRLAGLGKTS